jgi:hypothetical protein
MLVYYSNNLNDTKPKKIDKNKIVEHFQPEKSAFIIQDNEFNGYGKFINYKLPRV